MLPATNALAVVVQSRCAKFAAGRLAFCLSYGFLYLDFSHTLPIEWFSILHSSYLHNVRKSSSLSRAWAFDVATSPT